MSNDPAEQIPVKISVKTTIRNGQNKESYELTTFGQYYKKASATYLRYEEFMEEGTVKTIVKVSGQEGSILRNGAITMRLPFQKNKSMTGSYQSPYGVLEMKTLTTRISHEFDETSRSGEIDLLYDLHMQGAHAGTYHLSIMIEEEKQ